MPCYWPSPDHRAVNAAAPKHHDTVSALKCGTFPFTARSALPDQCYPQTHNGCTRSYNLQLTLCLFPYVCSAVDVEDRSKYVALGAECLLHRPWPWPSVAGARRDVGFWELLLRCFLPLLFSIPLQQLFCSFSVPVFFFFFIERWSPAAAAFPIWDNLFFHSVFIDYSSLYIAYLMSHYAYLPATSLLSYPSVSCSAAITSPFIAEFFSWGLLLCQHTSLISNFANHKLWHSCGSWKWERLHILF